MRTAFRSRHDWAHLAAQGSSLLVAIGRGVQFLTRSHRTALTESQVGSCATRHRYTLIHYGFRPGDCCDDSSFFVEESSAKLLW